MTELRILVHDNQKVPFLRELFASLDFVDLVEKPLIEGEGNGAAESANAFFDAAGIWIDRDVQLETLHYRAWSRQ